MLTDDQLFDLLGKNAELFAAYEEWANAQIMLLAGTVDDPNSFNEAGGKTGILGYYPVVNVSGQTIYVPCQARLMAIALGGSNAAVLEQLVAQVGGKIAAVDAAVGEALTAGGFADDRGNYAAAQGDFAKARGAETAALLNAAAALGAVFRSTIAAGIRDVPVDGYFTSAETGSLRLYQRSAAAPGYIDQGDEAAPLSRSEFSGTINAVARPFRTRVALAASATTNITATLTQPGLEGTFTWVSGDFSTLLAADPDNFIASTVQGAPQGAWARLPDRRGNRIYAVAHGVKDSQTVDSADVLQQLVNYYSGYTIVLPDNVALSHSITYSDGCHIVGRNKDKANVYLLKNFVGTAAFVPRARASDTDFVLRCKFHDILIVDASAANANRGSTSVLNGIDVTGTFDCELYGVKGVRLNIVISAKPGAAGKVQWTRRVRMARLDWGNVNFGFKFEPALDDRFPYGDVQITVTEAVGSCARGCWIEDTDGFQCSSNVAFSNGQLRMSGNALSVVGAHSFFAVAGVNDEANYTADGIFVSARAGGGRSTGVSIVGGLAFQTARLADTIKTIENPPAQTNRGGVAIRLQGVDGFNVQGMALDTSKESFTATGCTDGILSLTSLRANTQVLGSGALAAYNFDAVTLTNCQGVVITLADQSASKRYAVYADDTCKGIVIFGVATSGGTNAPSQVRLPDDASSYYSMLSGKPDGSFVLYASHVAIVPEKELTVNSTTPRGFFGRNGARGVLNNTASTHIIDLPDVPDGAEVFVRILDNGASKLNDVTQNAASKIKFKDGQTKLGRGYCVRLYREPYTHMLVEV